MVIATGKMEDGRVQIIIGLDFESIEVLKREPLVVSRETHGDVVPADIVISLYSGPSNVAIADRIKKERG